MIIYFRSVAKEIGCQNVDTMCDWDVWQFIINHQREISNANT